MINQSFEIKSLKILILLGSPDLELRKKVLNNIVKRLKF